MPNATERAPRLIYGTVHLIPSKWFNIQMTNRRSNMGIATTVKERKQPVLRKVNYWVRRGPESTSSPSQQAMETDVRNAYFWRR
jgi:hypothetical protein